MPPVFDSLYQGALTLAPEERVLLAEKILQSVESGSLSEEWMSEIEKRVKELENGEVETYTHDEVMQLLRENRARGNKISS
jgi:putative addiction module component (TIGR02574 family)